MLAADGLNLSLSLLPALTAYLAQGMGCWQLSLLLGFCWGQLPAKCWSLLWICSGVCRVGSAPWLTLSRSVRAGRVTQIWFWHLWTWAGPGVHYVLSTCLACWSAVMKTSHVPEVAEAAVPTWGEGDEELCRSSYVKGCQDVPVSVLGGMALN